MAPKTYRALCEKADNDPYSSEAERKDFTQLVTTLFDTTTDTAKNKGQLLPEVMMDVGPAIGMNGGLVVFMETRDKLGGTLQFLHNIALHTSGDNCNAAFAYFGNVEDGGVESVRTVPEGSAG